MYVFYDDAAGGGNFKPDLMMNGQFDPHNANSDKDKEFDGIIRPQELEDFSGQDKIEANLRIFVKAAKLRGNPLTMCCFTALQDSARPHLHI